jgi:hypothetical protein
LGASQALEPDANAKKQASLDFDPEKRAQLSPLRILADGQREAFPQ